MAWITRGKYKDRKCKVLQWANDWFSVEIDGTLPIPAIIKPPSIELDGSEMQEWKADPVGMDKYYQLMPNGKFRRRH